MKAQKYKELHNDSVSHLNPENWELANRNLLSKIISEFSHELIVIPKCINKKGKWSIYELCHPEKNIVYHFQAQILALDHWFILPKSIKKTIDNQSSNIDAVSFIIEFNTYLGFGEDNLPTYLEEIISCLYSKAYTQTFNTKTANELCRSDYQDVEHAMSAGHPCFVANNGRIGFDAIDYKEYAPEAASPFNLVWLAGHKSCTEFTGIPPLSYAEAIEQELSPQDIERFNKILEGRGLDWLDYYFFPAHPWQWHNKLIHLFASDIAQEKLVCLGYSSDKYLPQQSIRTFFNVTNPGKFYAKTALSILNMGFMRGLSAGLMRIAPAINKWVHDIVDNDDYLQQKRFTVLREIGTVGYTNTLFEAAFKTDTAYKKMLSSLWRESPLSKIQPGQKLITMAALLHVDNYGNSMLAALIQYSGLDTKNWIRKYLDCYLSPLLHCYYFYDMRFMPHGENLILVLEKGVPVRAIMKDIGEEVAIINQEAKIPDEIQRIKIPIPEELKILSIFTQIFDCFFRFLNQILVEHLDLPEDEFWGLVAECILDYQQTQPQLEEKFERYNLFAPEITKTCLNRLQIKNNQKMIDTKDPFKNQHFVGSLKNPLTVHQASLILNFK